MNSNQNNGSRQRSFNCTIGLRPEAVQALPSTQIDYYPGAIDLVAWRVKSRGHSLSRIRAEVELAIRNRPHAAVLHEARTPSFAYYRLSLSHEEVYFSVEPAKITVRGFGWKITGEPLDDWDGGGFFHDQ